MEFHNLWWNIGIGPNLLYAYGLMLIFITAETFFFVKLACFSNKRIILKSNFDFIQSQDI
jgi:hypothetical protein